MKPRTALLSVSDKTGLIDFAKQLRRARVEIFASGGTADALKKAGVRVTRLSRITGFKDMLDGRVKTLHPKIHAGILANRGNKAHRREMKKHKIRPIDMVVCNLYPFERTVAKENVSLNRAVENIDIGGVTLLRAAAKNFSHVAAVCDPKDYGPVASAVQRKNLSTRMRKDLALKAFEHVGRYDELIAAFLQKRFLRNRAPDTFLLSGTLVEQTRYGENPSQAAAVYAYREGSLLGGMKQLHGKQLSYNNYLDAHAALACVRELATKPTAVIVKHNIPCGVATAPTLSTAFKRALACDKVSAFGGVIALNKKCDKATARKISSFFNEVVLAPGYAKDALVLLTQNKNRRVLSYAPKALKDEVEVRSLFGGFLAQTPDTAKDTRGLRNVSKKKATKKQKRDLLFAAKVAKHVSSNAIVIAKNGATVGIGGGQPSRVDSVALAIKKAKGRQKGAVLAGDAFFPFPDGLAKAARAGVHAFLAPSGSIKDKDVIKAADRYKVALLFSRDRHFRH